MSLAWLKILDSTSSREVNSPETRKEIILNCVNCGAPMTLFRNQDYYFCEYCGSFHFPTASKEGIRQLGEDPDGIHCPQCRVPLQMVTLDDRFRGYQCGTCRGFLFNMTTFRDAIEIRRALATTPSDPPRPLNRIDLARKLDCPGCSHVMSTHPYLGPGAIVIDTCSNCGLIWLDHGELTQVINAPGKDRGKGLPIQSAKSSRGTHKKKARQKGRQEKDLISLVEKFFELDD